MRRARHNIRFASFFLSIFFFFYTIHLPLVSVRRRSSVLSDAGRHLDDRPIQPIKRHSTTDVMVYDAIYTATPKWIYYIPSYNMRRYVHVSSPSRPSRVTTARPPARQTSTHSTKTFVPNVLVRLVRSHARPPSRNLPYGRRPGRNVPIYIYNVCFKRINSRQKQ